MKLAAHKKLQINFAVSQKLKKYIHLPASTSIPKSQL